jgi:hypothetical protein
VIGSQTRWHCAAVALFVSALAIGVGVFAPASLIAVPIEHASENRLTLTAVSGSLWNGRGTLTARGNGARTSLSWTLNPWELFAGQVAGTLTVGSAAPSRFVVTRSALSVDAIDVFLPAALAAEAFGAYAGYKIGGRVQLRSQRAYFHRDSASARVTLDWRDATTGIVPVSPLGSYRVELEWVAGTGSVSVHTQEGPLFLDGGGRWSSTGAALSLTARPSTEQAEFLKPWLRTMTPEQPGGIFRFVWPQPRSRSPSPRPTG